MNTITLIQPDDWHAHLRDGLALQRTVPDLAKQFSRAICMPNLV
ncbi:dihydroorotase, partial [Acinetobacter sp. 207]